MPQKIAHDCILLCYILAKERRKEILSFIRPILILLPVFKTGCVTLFSVSEHLQLGATHLFFIRFRRHYQHTVEERESMTDDGRDIESERALRDEWWSG